MIKLVSGLVLVVCVFGAPPASAAQSYHRYCLPHPHVCLTALHTGRNSAVVLRAPNHSARQDLTYEGGELIFPELPGTCIGRNARTVHCGTTGTGWQGITTTGFLSKFWNVNLTVHDPQKRAHYLTAFNGSAVVSTDYRLPHKWRG